MTNSEQEQKKMLEIAKMEWEEFEKYLQSTTVRTTKGEGADEKALKEYFGEEEFKELQRLAREAQVARQRGVTPLGNIVLLPGIMGSYLVTVENGDEDLVWVNFFRLIKGSLGRLKLTDDGTGQADKKYEVKTSIIHKGTYARVMLKLRARWNVKPFAFDWRKDIDVSSRELAEFIEEEFKGEPVHLVAHSMGGLVSRNFIHHHKELWKSMRGNGNGSHIGRLIMLGTPNYGSFAIPQTMTGVEKMVRLLETADLKHNMKDILGIINTFVGSYEMLPAPGKIPAEIQAIYEKQTWGWFPVNENHLERARQFHTDLEKDEKTIDPERMSYIAGCNRETLSGLEIIESGKFKYFITLDGDGRVPHKLGLLEGIKTYYVEEDHGSLPKNNRVITAIDQLLERGETTVLSSRSIAARVALPDDAAWHRSIGEYLVSSELAIIARHAERDEVTPEDLRIAEETVMRAAMGDNRTVKRPPAKPGRKKSLRIDVVLGDVTKVAAPVVAVGHYKGVTPANAIKAIDNKLGGWISLATEQSMIGGELGQLFFIPVRRKQIAANGVLVAGMGQEGRFSSDDLSFLMLNVTQGISTLGLEKFASLVIGAGKGNLELDEALKAILLGVSEALDRMGDRNKLKRIIFVECVPDRHMKIVSILRRLRNENFPPNLKVSIVPREIRGARKEWEEWERKEKAIGSTRDKRGSGFGPRITIERNEDVFRLSALTKTAVIPVREVEIQSYFSEGMSDRLMASVTKEEQVMFGRLLHSLIPEEFQAYYDTAEPLTLILDRNTASFPWEMACFGRSKSICFFGTELQLTRQFRTLLSSAPAVAPELNDRLRVLVIADPAPDKLHLPGAQEEGQEVVRILNQIKQEFRLNIEVIDRVGPAECDPVEILALLHNEEFDVVHFAGHGTFDEAKPSRSGWVFGQDSKQPDKLRTLSALEIFRLRRVPRLVFSNACFSAVVHKGKALTAEEMNRNLAGLAEAFFERGVQNYVGAGWPVQDDLAISFTAEFYAHALIGRPANKLSGSPSNAKTLDSDKRDLEPSTLGKAVSEARKLIRHNGSTWGAYQHYGQANDKLIKLKDNSESEYMLTPKAAPKTKRKAGSKIKRKK